MRQAMVGVATGFFLILAFSFGLAAFTVWLVRQIGVVPALGFIGLGFLIIAALVVAMATATDKTRRGPKPKPIAEAVKQEFVATEAEPPPTGSTLGAMGAVALIAFLFARQIIRR